MRNQLPFYINLSFLVVAGCAIHPAPKDVQSFDTAGIVDHIKCETAKAIEDKTISKLRASDEQSARDLADELDRNRGNFVNSRPKTLVTGRQKAFYDRYIDAEIAFDFTLTTSEESAASAQVDFARVITNGALSVPLAASDDRIRQSIQTFTITESFKSLLDKSKDCGSGSFAPNFAYPISGSIGVYNVINNFVDLNEEKDLTQRKGLTNIYSDALTFTTTVMGSVVPRLVLTSPTGVFI